MTWCRTVISSLLMHWRYYSFALTHWYLGGIFLNLTTTKHKCTHSKLQPNLSGPMRCKLHWRYKLMALCKTVVTPVHQQSSYCSLTLIDQYRSQYTMSSLILVLAWHLFGAKLLPEPILFYCKLHLQKPTSVKFIKIWLAFFEENACKHVICKTVGHLV